MVTAAASGITQKGLWPLLIDRLSLTLLVICLVWPPTRTVASLPSSRLAQICLVDLLEAFGGLKIRQNKRTTSNENS
jgi:uncharacterized membrane protein YqjE